MPDRETIKKFPVFDALMPGAKITIEKCLSIKSGDKVTLICDHHSAEPSGALVAVLEEIKADYTVFVLENHVTRPATELPKEIIDKIRGSSASIYAAEAMPGEYDQRMQVLKTVSINRVKHAHILGLDANTLIIGMAADYEKIARIGDLLIRKLGAEPTLNIKSFSGTDVTIVPDVIYKPLSFSGIITPELWENLPTGEVVFMPKEIDGVYVCDGHLPLDLVAKKTDLIRHPLRVTFKNGRVDSVEGGPGDVASQVTDTLTADENARRVGMACIGINYGIKAWSGNFGYDSYSPCAYLVAGDNSDTFAVPWKSTSQLHFLGKRTSLLFDDEPIITAGQFDPAFLNQVR